jgi:hypothetical protein
MTRRFEPQDGASGLAAHPHRFTLRGAPGTLAFPALCAHCGNPAPDKLPCSKVFRRVNSDAPNSHVVVSVAVPYCSACIAQHRSVTPPLTPLAKVLSSFSTGEMLGAVFPALAAAFLAYLGLKDLLRGDLIGAAILLAIGAAFGALARFQWRHVWEETEHLRVPPQSDVSRAFDFSDDMAPSFEPPRFVCTVRDARFAAAFEALNGQHAWVADSPAARADRRDANRQMWIIGAIVAAIALAGFIVDWLR